MGLGGDIGRILGQYSGGGGQQFGQGEQVEQDFDNVAQNTPHEELSQGLSEAFRSDQTPPFGNMVGQLFGQADTNQRTGMLNHMLGALGPAVIGSILGRGMGGGGLGGALGGGMGGGLGGGLAGGILGSLLNRGGGQQQVQLSPQEVEQLSPEEVEQLASHAEREHPGIIDHMSQFYAQNPQMVKALGGAALAIALGKMAQRNRG